jgi:biopolymer transport protein TolR
MAGAVDENDDDDVIAQINVIPFVDITLVLLIIFLLTANIIARASIPVELPRAAAAGESVEATANVVVTATGALFLDGNAVTRDVLVANVRERTQAEPKLRAAIAADRAVRYEAVVEVIDALKVAGVSAFALNIERPTP